MIRFAAQPRFHPQILALCVAVVVGTVSTFAMEPPDPGSLEQYQRDGSYARRLEFVRQVGNHKLRPDVAQRTSARLQMLFNPEPSKDVLLPRWQGMPTKGTNKVLVLLVDFPDYPHVNEASVIANKLFGDGDAAEYPKESLRNYYRRASYGQLEIQGSVLGWYRMQHPRSWYTADGQDNAANRVVMQEVIEHFDPVHDFSQYDNNHDGKVDYFAIIWSGPDNGWGNFWWGYQWRLAQPIVADGVQFAAFSWQWESRPVGSAFEAETVIHETGHALGLPDYYDYTPNQGGPNGGVGGLDMMHGNYADHNAFSKFMLEWVTPRTIGSGEASVTLRALAQSPDALAIMPNYQGATPYTEYFMVENRQRVNNDARNPSDGILIWHIDATPNARGDDFLYNNSDTPHKLLRLMEADGLEEIENGDGKADAGDYYNQGESFSPTSQPNSHAYDGSDTGVAVGNFSAAGPTMTLSCSVGGTQTGTQLVCNPLQLQQQTTEGVNPAEQSFEISTAGATVGYAIADDAAWLSVSPANGTASPTVSRHTISYASAGLPPGVYHGTITVTAPDANNSPQSIQVTLTVMGNDLARALDGPGLQWTTGGNANWFEQTTETRDGQDAAQSGAPADSQNNWIQTTITGPGTLSFWWRCSSEAGYDFLLLYVDNELRPERLSGLTEWQPLALQVPVGSHTVRWAYAKDGSVAANADAAWVDQVSFTSETQAPALACTPASLTQFGAVGQNAPSLTMEVWNEGGGAMSYNITDNADWLTVNPPAETSSGAHNQHAISFASANLNPGSYEADIVVTAPGATGSPKAIHVTLTVLAAGNSLAEATDFSGPWTTGASAAWSAQTVTTHDLQDAAASGTIGDLQESWIQTTVQGPGVLSFWWKVSSEADYDWLALYVDDQYAGRAISGEEDWRQEFVFVPAGSHTLTWSYSKDDYVSAGADAGWLDQVSFAPGDGGIKTVLEADFANGLPEAWVVKDYVSSGVRWAFNDPGNRGNNTGGAATFAIADGDYWNAPQVDTDLISSAFDCSGLTNVVLEFQTDLNLFLASADVDLFVDGAWTTVATASSSVDGPAKVTLPLPEADGKAQVAVSFHYYYDLGLFSDFWWAVDNVKVTGQSSAGSAGGLLSEWRKAWDDFYRNYAGFVQKGVNWGPVYDANTNAFAHAQDGAQFAEQLNSAVQLLHDWQVTVQKPDGTWLGYNGPFTNNYPPSWFTSYTGGVPYDDLKGAHVLYHAWVNSTLGHIIVTSLETAGFAGISDADIESVFDRYQNAEGIILDLRAISGGAETNALRIASHFTAAPATYGYTRTRITGGDTGAFAPFAPKTLLASAGRRFSGKVVCAIGQHTGAAGEWCALMLRACPGISLLGDRTRGASGISADFSIPSLGVVYRITRQLGYDAQQVPFEDVGIFPDFALPVSGSYDEAAQRDFVLERAIAMLKTPVLTVHRLPGNAVGVAWNGDVNNRYTLLRTTNMAHPVWEVAPGWNANRQGTAGTMWYTNTQPNSPIEAYRLQVSQ